MLLLLLLLMMSGSKATGKAPLFIFFYSMLEECTFHLFLDHHKFFSPIIILLSLLRIKSWLPNGNVIYQIWLWVNNLMRNLTLLKVSKLFSLLLNKLFLIEGIMHLSF